MKISKGSRGCLEHVSWRKSQEKVSGSRDGDKSHKFGKLGRTLCTRISSGENPLIPWTWYLFHMKFDSNIFPLILGEPQLKPGASSYHFFKSGDVLVKPVLDSLHYFWHNWSYSWNFGVRLVENEILFPYLSNDIRFVKICQVTRELHLFKVGPTECLLRLAQAMQGSFVRTMIES